MLHIAEYSNLILALSVAAIAIATVFVILKFSQFDANARSSLKVIEGREFYSEYGHLRERLEDQIAQINHQLIDTRREFERVNHLLLESQRSAKELPTNIVENKKYDFLSNLGIADTNIDNSLVFVLTPFGARERLTYSAIVAAFDGFNARVLRGDEERRTDVLSHIVGLIVKAKLIIANVSTRNPNVMYELGIAHALGKPVIMISNTQDTEVTFDLRNQTIVFYNTRRDLVESLRKEVARQFFDLN